MENTLILYKALRDTNFFKKGQKIWGVMNYHAICRYKGTGHWVRVWTHPDEWHGNPDTVRLGEVEVSPEFYEKIDTLYWER